MATANLPDLRHGPGRPRLRLVVGAPAEAAPSPRRRDPRGRDGGRRYGDLRDRIVEVAGVLQSHPDPDIGESARCMQAWTDEFIGDGVDRLVELMGALGGGAILAAARRDPVAGPLLDHYGHG